MIGKFRKRSEAVWCPKPQLIVDQDKLTEEQRLKLKELKDTAQMLYETKHEFHFEKVNAFEETLPQKIFKKFTGWHNISYCENCRYLEEFSIENDGVFCLWKPKLLEQIDFSVKARVFGHRSGTNLCYQSKV